MAEKANCWCCAVTIEVDDKCAKPFICEACMKGEHRAIESPADMFMVSTDCKADPCKAYRSLRVSRQSAQKLFNNRDLIKCKACGKAKTELKIVKSWIVDDDKAEEILPTKEWRGKTPEEAAAAS